MIISVHVNVLIKFMKAFVNTNFSASICVCVCVLCYYVRGLYSTEFRNLIICVVMAVKSYIWNPVFRISSNRKKKLITVGN